MPYICRGIPRDYVMVKTSILFNYNILIKMNQIELAQLKFKCVEFLKTSDNFKMFNGAAKFFNKNSAEMGFNLRVPELYQPEQVFCLGEKEVSIINFMIEQPEIIKNSVRMGEIQARQKEILKETTKLHKESSDLLREAEDIVFSHVEIRIPGFDWNQYLKTIKN